MLVEVQTCRDNPSALQLDDPGLYLMMKSNRLRISFHLASCALVSGVEKRQAIVVHNDCEMSAKKMG